MSKSRKTMERRFLALWATGGRLSWLAGLTAVVLLASAVSAYAQSGWPSWPWSSEPERRPAPPAAAPPSRPYRAEPPSAPDASGRSPRERFCAQLENRLAQSWMQSKQGQTQLPAIEQQMRQAERSWRRAEQQLERADCFDYFLFTKTLRQSRQCIDLSRQVESFRRQFGELEAQRQSIVGTRDGRSQQDELIQALARNGCGQNYQQEAARRERDNNPFGFLWQGEEEGGRGGGMRQSGAMPFATYRTVCVRSCDGYYFPISFSTMQSQFDRDANACRSKCAAPAELYYHQNPGSDMEQAMSVNGQPYSRHPNAFRHRKEYVPGCSCRQAEYKPDLLNGNAQSQPDKKAAAPARPPQGGKAQAQQQQPQAQSEDLIARTIQATREKGIEAR